MLMNAIGDFLPMAVAVALSPIPIIAVTVILGTPRARTNGPAFALGWVVGLAAVIAIVLVVAGGADNPDSATSTSINWIELGLGLLFLAMAAKQWKQRPKRGEESTMPKWMASVDNFTPAKSVAFGLALTALNPKNLTLTLAAAASIAEAGLSADESAVAAAVFVVIGSLTVAGAVLFFVVAADKALGRAIMVNEVG